MPSDPIFSAICLQNFYILGGTHLFTQASDPRSVLQSEPPFAESLTDLKDQLFLQWLGWPTPGSRTCYVQRAIPPITHMVVLKATSYWWRTLPWNNASYWPRLGLAIGWPSHWLVNYKALRGDLDPNGIRWSKIISQ